MANRFDPFSPPPLPPPLRPGRLRLWRWLGFSALSLPLAIAMTLIFGGEVWQHETVRFWSVAVGVPLLGVSMLFFIRTMVLLGQPGVAEGWSEALDADRVKRLRHGRCSQQILAVSLHSALPPCGMNERRVRSGLIAPENVLLGAFAHAVAELAPTLKQLPETTPLVVVLDVDSGLPTDVVQGMWQQAWGASGLRQTARPFGFSGLAAVEHWLGKSLADPGLLMVMAVQTASRHRPGAAEVAVGLLLGRRMLPTTPAPVASLYRPGQQREAGPEALRDAAHQALEWASLPASAIERVWQTGVDPRRSLCLATVLSAAGLPQAHKGEMCKLNALLGQVGNASPWLGIAAASQKIKEGAGPQFMFSGDGGVEDGLWCTVLTPAPPLLKQGVSAAGAPDVR